MQLTLFFATALLLSSVSAVLFAAERGEEIRLWPNGAPGSEGITAPEVSTPSRAARNSRLPGGYSVTHYPSIYGFLPPKEKATGAAIIVAPGGGHRGLVIEREGWEMADWLNERGIAAFVLKYRLSRVQGSTYSLTKEVFADAARSIRLVRSRAAEWGVDPARIGFIGFSAGAEVAGMISVKYDAGAKDSADPIERASSRPDFNIMLYGYYRPGSVAVRPANAPPGGGPPPSVTAQALEPIIPNADFRLQADAPPVFMVCATDDPVHVIPTVKYYLELVAQKIPAEMHIYEYGDHGFALRPTKKPGSPVESWPVRLTEWLAAKGISK